MSRMEIIALLNEGKQNIEVAKQLGISKQYVSQIAKSMGIIRREKRPQACKECNRSLDQVSYYAKGLCIACSNYRKSDKPHHRYRTIFYPKNCIDCDLPFTKKRRPTGDGRCRKCYNRTPSARIWKNAYMRAYSKNPLFKEKRKPLQREYYRKKQILKRLRRVRPADFRGVAPGFGRECFPAV